MRHVCEENDLVLAQGARFAIPLRVCLDLRHGFMNGRPEEADHLAWIDRYAARCDVIDCQQTDREGERHWAFTEEANRKGINLGELVAFRAIEESGADEVLLAFEIRTPAFFRRKISISNPCGNRCGTGASGSPIEGRRPDD